MENFCISGAQLRSPGIDSRGGQWPNAEREQPKAERGEAGKEVPGHQGPRQVQGLLCQPGCQRGAEEEGHCARQEGTAIRASDPNAKLQVNIG